jgi:hypothetical protein
MFTHCLKINKPMKMKHASILAAVIVASVGANSAQAIQKHDPIFQSAHTTVSQKNDPDLVHQLRNQSGSPHGKADLYVARPTSSGADRDLAREIRYQNGSPRSRSDQSFYLAPLK